MFGGKSLFKCKYCGREKEAVAGSRQGCINCNVAMEEVKKGIINKTVTGKKTNAKKKAVVGNKRK